MNQTKADNQFDNINYTWYAVFYCEEGEKMKNTAKKTVGLIREFNRYYTNVLGLLDQYILKSDFSLSEVRVLKEIEKTENCTPKLLAETLCMDSGYLSRILKNFEDCGFLSRTPSPDDGRSHFLFLTEKGKKEMVELNARADEQIYDLIRHLPEADQIGLAQKMKSIENLLTGHRNIKFEDFVIRHTIKQGDVGYLTYMHGWIYAQEYNYGAAFEGYVAKSFYEFLTNYDPERDRLWIAEHNGEIVGSIGIVGRGDRAQLRWFLLRPGYRGVGLGKYLLNDSIEYCRRKGFRTIYLGTTGDLETAISMYTRAGFVKVAEKENNTWANNIVELEFELDLEKAK